ncbi:hypothetical protein [Acinetobacter nosocomialis]|uniref:hypothetical protein n=1 Tax=Acinetobacter nosocomialis TaxID=106654 RepID=UPI00125D9FFA|nr:hypothetical protein [Acinetobacter nosocomialis]
MPRVASIIPPESKGSLTLCNGTKVLLDNGEYLQHVNKITLVAEPGQPLKAVIEVHPTNQEQIDALLEDVEVIKRHKASSRLDEIEKEIQQLQDEKVLIERDRRSKVTGLSIAGIADVPLEGTFLVDKGERVLKPPKNDTLTDYLKNNHCHSKINSPIGVAVGRHTTTAKMTNEDFVPQLRQCY